MDQFWATFLKWMKIPHIQSTVRINELKLFLHTSRSHNNKPAHERKIEPWTNLFFQMKFFYFVYCDDFRKYAEFKILLCCGIDKSLILTTFWIIEFRWSVNQRMKRVLEIGKKCCTSMMQHMLYCLCCYYQKKEDDRKITFHNNIIYGNDHLISTWIVRVLSLSLQLLPMYLTKYTTL